MNEGNSTRWHASGKRAWMIGLGILASVAAGQAAAGCTHFSPGVAPPANWMKPTSMMTNSADPMSGFDALVPIAFREDRGFMRVNDEQRGGGPGNAGIVGLWKFTFAVDGAQPGSFLDFGTVIWHADGTEVTISGGRPPSTGDICMGAWKQVGPNTYKLNHIALAWVSSDTPPEAGGPQPAAFLGPGIETQVVTLSRSGNSFEGRFTLDQYQADGKTLVVHFAGKVVATRITAD